LRLNPALAEAVSRLAQRELRSVNAQLEFLIREGVARRGVKLRDEAGVTGGATGEPPNDADASATDAAGGPEPHEG